MTKGGFAVFVMVVGVACACGVGPAASPPRGPEATCVAACSEKAPRCGEQACARGCNLVLDRLIEHEGQGLVACVAGAGGPCDDRTWARCAARVGPHADGGPPPPAPPRDDD